jgi:YVTN family beta-propeller protein
MKHSLSLLLLSTLLAIGTQARADDDDLPGLDVPGQEQKLNAELWRFAKNTSYEALQQDLEKDHAESAQTIPTEIRLPNGWRMTPAGNQLELGRYPLVITPFAGNLVVLNNGYYVETAPEISIVSGDGAKLLKTLNAPSMFPCAKAGLDGMLYVSGGYDQTIRGFNGDLQEVKDFSVNGFASGLAPVDKSTLAVGYLLMDNGQGNYKSGGRLALVDTRTGDMKDEIDCGRLPYALEFQDGKLFASLLQDNAVAVYSIKAGRLKLLKTLSVGNTPSAFAPDPKLHRLYVMNQNSDEITVLNSLTLRAEAAWNLRQKGYKFGMAPTSGWAAGGRLYVTLSRFNALAVVDTRNGHVEGYIPTGWYPTAVAGDGTNLYVLSAKGIHERRPNPDGPQPTKKREEPGYVLTLLKGSLGAIPLSEVDSNLSHWTDTVNHASPLFNPAQGLQLPIKHVFYIVKENRTYDQVLGDLGTGNGDKSLCIFGSDVTPNHHQIAKDFADLDNFFVDGEISVLGHSYTTSGYASPFLEWLGMNDYSGRLGAKGATNPRKNEDFWPFGTVPFTFSPTYLWDAMDAKSIDYRIYGEDYIFYCKPYRLLSDKFGEESPIARKCYDRLMAISKDKVRDTAFQVLVKDYIGRNGSKEDCLKLLDDPDFLQKLSTFYTGDDSLAQAIASDAGFKAQWAAFLYHCSFDFLGWDLSYSDLKRVAVWQADFNRQVASGHVLPLHYIWLPNDHTAGTDSNSLNPDQLVGQNDAAVGAILDTVSKSPVWKESLVVVIEDDSQNGPDHVDAMRSFCLAAGPYVKRGGVVISDLYDQLSLLKTLELILGIDPMSMNDGLAAPMFSLFSDKPDDSPYMAPPPSKYLTKEDQETYSWLLEAQKDKPLSEILGGGGSTPASVR